MRFKADTSIRDETGNFLDDVCKGFGRKINILELGTGAGQSTKILANYANILITMDDKLACIEYTQNRLSYKNNIKYILGYDPKDIPDIKFDLVFIDGPEGSEARRVTFPKLWTTIKSGGLILLDDANRSGEKVALEEWSKKFNFEYELKKIGRGIGIFKKCISKNIAILCNTKMYGGGERSAKKLLEMMQVKNLSVEGFTLTPDNPITPNMKDFNRDWRTCTAEKQIYVMNDKIYRLQNEEFMDFYAVASHAKDLRFVVNFVNGGLSRKEWLSKLPVKKVIFLNSKKEAAWRQDAFKGNLNIPTTILPPPVDIDEFIKDPINFRENAKVVGSHGGKAADDSAKIFSKIKEKNDVVFHFLPGNPRLVLGDKLNSSNCVFKPKTLDTQEIINHLDELDVYVYHLNSSQHTQGPRTVIEAMARGLPVVTDDCSECGMKDRIEHGVTGFLCRDKEDMVQAIHTLLNDSNLRFKMGYKARKAAARTQPTKWLAELL